MLLRMTRRRWSDLVWPAQSTHRRQARAWRRRQSLGTMGLALLVRCKVQARIRPCCSSP